MEFKLWLENFQKCQKLNYLETKQSQYGRYFPRKIDGSNVFATEYICLRPAEGKHKTSKQKKNLKEENNYFGWRTSLSYKQG